MNTLQTPARRASSPSLAASDATYTTQELATLEQVTTDARRRIVKGELVELSALSKRTALFCENVARLTPEDRLRIAPRIGALVTELDLLGEEVKRRRDALIAQQAQQQQTKR